MVKIKFKMQIYLVYTSCLTAAVCIEKLGLFSVQKSEQLTTKIWYHVYFVLLLKL